MQHGCLTLAILLAGCVQDGPYCVRDFGEADCPGACEAVCSPPGSGDCEFTMPPATAIEVVYCNGSLAEPAYCNSDGEVNCIEDGEAARCVCRE